MTTTTTGTTTAAGTPAPAERATTTTVRDRLTALGRAEVTLLARNRTAVFVALLMPAAMVLAMKSTLKPSILDGSGLSVAGAALTGGIGIVLIQAVYMNMVSSYVARREDLVLKRLRTGEVADREILVGTALPSAALALAQIVVIVVAGTVFFDLDAPKRPDLLLAGLLLGVVMLTALAGATSAITRTVQTSQLTTLPLFLVSMMGSGLFVPLEVMPDRVAAVCELLPVTGSMTLVRAGWLGGAEGSDLLVAALTGLAWTAFAVFAVQRWFRWEPRR
ncbi:MULTISPECIES: ABC transporter permease [unclassified Streptomyces]|uniref:ABC transporter permease n=1 Tax=unclassified Streptomyces TaxID=2593676 RepID=UPI0011E71942|nr:ABC transporter permease [Streptomyces sp. sk2.1]TXS72057.1 ABC transporter permease [Streptomyces sp. sk2.1]